MKALPPEREQEARKARDDVLKIALEAFDAYDRRYACRKEFVQAIHQAIESSATHALRAAMGNQELSLPDKSKLSYRVAVGQAYLAAFIELINSGSTQWDDRDLLAGQFRNMLHVVMGRCNAMDLHTGEISKI